MERRTNLRFKEYEYKRSDTFRLRFAASSGLVLGIATGLAVAMLTRDLLEGSLAFILMTLFVMVELLFSAYRSIYDTAKLTLGEDKLEITTDPAGRYGDIIHKFHMHTSKILPYDKITDVVVCKSVIDILSGSSAIKFVFDRGDDVIASDNSGIKPYTNTTMSFILITLAEADGIKRLVDAKRHAV